MISSHLSFSKKWSQVFQKPALEFALTPLTVLEGKLPDSLQGTLYRNGSANMQRGKEKVGHWFDGDGAVLAVHFRDNQAIATYRYIQTPYLAKETQNNRFLYANYGRVAEGKIWKRWGKPIKNCANTSVLTLNNRLLALWEGGYPYALDLETLQTLGEDQLDQLKPLDTFSAHPKIDPQTGDIYNFGVIASLTSQLVLYRLDATGKIHQRSTISLSGLPLIHDFILTQSYLIFCISPVRVNLLPAILSIKSFSDSMEWKPQLGTEILIVDRNTLQLVKRNVNDAWYQWHFTNGYEINDHELLLEFVKFPDFTTNQNLKEIATGEIKTTAKGTLHRTIINPKTATVIHQEELWDRGCEFPTISPNDVTQNWRYTYFNAHRNSPDSPYKLFEMIACHDRKTNAIIEIDCGVDRYPSEPIFVSENGDKGWIITVIYDGNNHQSEVWIYNSQSLQNTPVCRLLLPQVIPPSFHGVFRKY